MQYLGILLVFNFFLFFSNFSLETSKLVENINEPIAPNVAWKDIDWLKIGSKRMCQVNTCSTSYASKSLLIQHLKLKHDLVVEKNKIVRPSTCESGPRRQDHQQMNAHVLSDAQAIQRQND
jgi:hypothetical protein